MSRFEDTITLPWKVVTTSATFGCLTEISLENFRGFRETGSLDLAPLTFLVGPNSSGKSSLTSAILLLAQSRFAPLGILIPRWSSSLVDLGSYNDTVFGHDARRRIVISVKIMVPVDDIAIAPQLRGRLFPFQITYSLQRIRGQAMGVLTEASVIDLTSAYYVRARRLTSRRIEVARRFGGAEEASTLTVSDIDQGFSSWSYAVRSLIGRPRSATQRKQDGTAEEEARTRLYAVFGLRSLDRYLQGIERVSSGRGGPQRWYSTGAIARDAARSTSRGTLFDTVDPTIMYADSSRSVGSRTAGRRLNRALANQLKELGIASAIRSRAISPYHSAIEVRDSVTGVKSNLMEVGYGASQVLPVVRACLSRSSSPLFLEQPEIHLHPKAQGDVAEL